ncbi:MAG: hypothetical protein HY897_02820 [Deltaproteobacteria bacterium]|nr:hypothetical protein [Deltaproteobacteria bacterium]
MKQKQNPLWFLVATCAFVLWCGCADDGGGKGPAVPHAVKATDDKSCLACHKDGTNGAPKAPHPDKTGCTSCHAAPDPVGGDAGTDGRTEDKETTDDGAQDAGTLDDGSLDGAQDTGEQDGAGADSGPGQDAGTGADGAEASYPPILVSAMVHMDPLPSGMPEQQILNVYQSFRDGVVWYADLAAKTGLRISAQSTGVYAEAVVFSGHEGDFLEFMPGGTHHLGTHLHANVRGVGSLAWTDLPDQQKNDPASVLQVFNDNIPFVNAIFEANGFGAADNWYFHGTHASYTGMDGPLYSNDGTAATAYPNTYDTCGAVRGTPRAFRGSCGDPSPAGEASADGRFVKIAEVGGIIGYDELHGPEGMVYGTVPYQRRDFLRVFLEWRENARLFPETPPLHFNYMIHPYQLVAGKTGTDGAQIRQSISDFVEWLWANFAGKTDPRDRIVAIFGTVPDIKRRFSEWETAHAGIKDSLAAEVNTRTFFRRLPGIHAALDRAYHEEALDLGAGVTAHRFVERDTGADWVLLFSDEGTVTVPAGGHVPAERDVMSGDGTVTRENSPTLAVGESPVLVGPPGAFEAQDGGNGDAGGPSPDGGFLDGGPPSCADGGSCPPDRVCCPSPRPCAGLCVADCRLDAGFACPPQAPNCDPSTGLCGP